MYAVIKTGGKLYRVKAGQTVKVEKLEEAPGTRIKFSDLLMVTDGDKTHIGQPLVKGFTVEAEVVEEGRHEKIRIIKMRRRKHHMKRMGHRQYYTKLKIIEIKAA